MTPISTNIFKAKKILENEDLVAIPTETVYGLAGNIFSEKAINKIFRTKNRPTNNPLIVHIHSVELLEKIAIDIPENAKKLAASFWPGALTLVLKKKNVFPIV
jgi:L-threonylcarbamoyladenylate synthase